MPQVYDKLEQLLGTGSIPDTDLFGNTTGYGDYTATGIDVWSLPGVISTMPHNGTFKRGPSTLYTSTNNRQYWWGARIRDVDTPIVDIYSVGVAGSTLRTSSSAMPAMPRSFDFELNQNGYPIIVADIDGMLYGYYSFSSSLGWQLIASSAFTPKLLYGSGTCGLVFVDNYNTYTMGVVESGTLHSDWYPRIHTKFTDTMFATTTGAIYYPAHQHEVVTTGIFVTSSVTDSTGVYWGWSGSLSGTLMGILTGSMRGHLTGTFSDGPYGSGKVLPPSMYYGTLIGEMTGIFGGNFVGTAIATGSFYGSLLGDFGGTYYTVAGTTVTPTTQTMGAAPSGDKFWSGSISGTLVGGVYPYSESAVRPVYFVNDFVPTKSNKMQLTYGRYDPVSQHVNTSILTSRINVVSSGAVGQLAGGAIATLEILEPRDRVVPPFATQTTTASICCDPPFSAPSTQLPTTLPGLVNNYIAGRQVTFLLNNAIGRWDYQFMWDWPSNAFTPFSRENTATKISNDTAWISICQSMLNYGRGGGWRGESSRIDYVGYDPNNPQYPPLDWEHGELEDGYIVGILTPSLSRNDTEFHGSHMRIPSGNYGFTTYTDFSTATTYTIMANRTGTNAYGIHNIITFMTVGVKAVPIVSETCSFTCSMTPQTMFFNSQSTVQYSQSISASMQPLLLGLREFGYCPVPNWGVPPVYHATGSALDQYDPAWYPRIDMILSFTGSSSHTRYQTSMSVDSYLIAVRSNGLF